MQQYTMSLKNGIIVEETEKELFLAGYDGKCLHLQSPSPELKNLLANLAVGGLTANELAEAASHADHKTDLARTYYFLDIMEQKRWLCYTAAPGKLTGQI